MTSLWRNREFTLLWTSQTLSDLGDAVARLAMPLLVLALTGSAVQAGAVGTVAQLVQMVMRLPGGVLADRVNRRRAMLISDAIRLATFAGLALAVATHRADLPFIIVVAVIDSICGTLFQTSEHAALRTVVEPKQLPAAVARNEARAYGASLVGPPLGGLLFGLAAGLPFLGNAVSYLASLAGVAMIRKPLQAAREVAPASGRTELAEGLRFVFRNDFLRAVLVIAAPLNFAINGTIFTIILSLQRHGVTPGAIGLTETIVGVGGLVGALLAPTLQQWLAFPLLIRCICWTTVVMLVLSAMLTATLAAALPLALVLLLGPTTNAALFGYQAAITPDRLQGRVVSVIFLVATSVSAAAPALSGVLVSSIGATTAVLFFAGAVTIAALAATFAAGIRKMQPIEEAAPA